jgi:integrase
MATTRKIGDEIISFETRRGVLVYRLTKRMPDGSLHIARNFTMRKKRNGRQYYFPLPSTQRDAENQANAIDAFLDVRSNTMDMAVQRFTPERWERLNPTAKVATVGDILDAHEAAQTALGLGGRTGTDYRGNLLILFRLGLGRRRSTVPADEQIRAMSLSELTVRLANDFKVSRVELAGEDKQEQERKKRSANGVLRSVRALFSKDAREHYSHLHLPSDLEATLDRMAFRKVGKIKKRMPPGEVMRRLFNDAHELRATDRNAYIAFLLGAHAGFRKAEITGAVRDWIERGDRPRLWVRSTPEFLMKDKDERFVEVQQWVIDEIEALCESPALLLTGKKSERERSVFDRLNAWVKSKGLAEKKGEKGVHALRFLFGSYVTNKHGIYTAQKFLGHESPETTNTHYADIMLDKTLNALWENRPAWAVPAAKKDAVVARDA